MPIRCFWELSRNINRISAQENMRDLSIAMYAQSSDSAFTYREQLELEMGTVFEYSYSKSDVQREKLDREGLGKLRALSTKKS